MSVLSPLLELHTQTHPSNIVCLPGIPIKTSPQVRSCSTDLLLVTTFEQYICIHTSIRRGCLKDKRLLLCLPSFSPGQITNAFRIRQWSGLQPVLERQQLQRLLQAGLMPQICSTALGYLRCQIRLCWATRVSSVVNRIYSYQASVGSGSQISRIPNVHLGLNTGRTQDLMAFEHYLLYFPICLENTRLFRLEECSLQLMAGLY